MFIFDSCVPIITFHYEEKKMQGKLIDDVETKRDGEIIGKSGPYSPK